MRTTARVSDKTAPCSAARCCSGVIQSQLWIESERHRGYFARVPIGQSHCLLPMSSLLTPLTPLLSMRRANSAPARWAFGRAGPNRARGHYRSQASGLHDLQHSACRADGAGRGGTWRTSPAWSSGGGRGTSRARDAPSTTSHVCQGVPIIEPRHATPRLPLAATSRRG